MVRDRYRQHFMDKFNAQGQSVQDFSGSLAPGVGRDKIDEAVKRGDSDRQGHALQAQTEQAAPAVQNVGEKMGAQMATQGAQQGSLAGTAGGAMMMTGNPYLMAGGLGLSVLAAGEQNKRNEQEAQRQAYNQRIAQRQQAMSQIASMGIQ